MSKIGTFDYFGLRVRRLQLTPEHNLNPTNRDLQHTFCVNELTMAARFA
jgi:hypothetical protein